MITEAALTDGTRAFIWPLLPQDREALRDGYEGLSPESRNHRFLSSVPAGGRLERFRLVPTRANGQPALGCYQRDPHTPIAHAYGLMVLTLQGDRVAAITGFPDTSVFGHFGLPRTLRQ